MNWKVRCRLVPGTCLSVSDTCGIVLPFVIFYEVTPVFLTEFVLVDTLLTLARWMSCDSRMKTLLVSSPDTGSYGGYGNTVCSLGIRVVYCLAQRSSRVLFKTFNKEHIKKKRKESRRKGEWKRVSIHL